MTSSSFERVLETWKYDFSASQFQSSEWPRYFYNEPESLVSDAVPSNFVAGSGDDIFSAICPKIEDVKTELIIVTCFWASSSSKERLITALRLISARAVQERRPKVKVFIGLSSVSLSQKLFHTNAVSGYTYPPSTWSDKLGLPSKTELEGIDLVVKSIFIKPFSVMHPKFIVADRSRVWLPSCNVSWEQWFEGCLELSGPIVTRFLRFWHEFWLSSNDKWRYDVSAAEPNDSSAAVVENETSAAVSSVFLPSPHHVNPMFRPLPWQRHAPSPPTPLNVFLLNLFNTASRSIHIQTPNVTSPPVLSAILRALGRGIDVSIITSERLMRLEQLVTAGSTTSQCMKRLVRRYNRLNQQARNRDEEAGWKIGTLSIQYYQPRSTGKDEIVQSHLKMTIVDKEWIVLGSGNMDRASWYTSQELGVAFFDTRLVMHVTEQVDEALRSRLKVCFHSDRRTTRHA